MLGEPEHAADISEPLKVCEHGAVKTMLLSVDEFLVKVLWMTDLLKVSLCIEDVGGGHQT